MCVAGADQTGSLPTSDSWPRSGECARSVSPAETWRAALAESLREEAGVAFALVLTCPAGDIRGARGSLATSERQYTFPDELADLAGFLPHIDACEPVPTRANCAARMTMAEARNRSLVDALGRALHPLGAIDLLTAYLVDAQGLIIGCLTLGTSLSAKEELRASGPMLTQIAEVASSTLRSALGLARGCLGEGPTSERLLQLSAREAQVASLAVRGLSDQEIALRLGISQETVGSHLRRMYSKLQIRSRMDLLRWWFGLKAGGPPAQSSGSR
jgi:DNA-binding CsgD family transcriptional regulator